MLDRAHLIDLFRRTRARTVAICAPLAVEDHVVQTMIDVSPPKWHLGHTTWFFEEFLLAAFGEAYRPYHPRYAYVFNSYYESVGNRVARQTRGLLSRPTVADVCAYREAVDEAVTHLLEVCPDARLADLTQWTVLGCEHEQQHQELLHTDLKHILAANPLDPAYAARPAESPSPWQLSPTATRSTFATFEGGLVDLGFDAAAQQDAFHYDNEGPRHRAYVEPFRLARRLVTNAEFVEFIAAGGYENHGLWLSEGWDWVRQARVSHPLYWRPADDECGEEAFHGIDTTDGWAEFTLNGVRRLIPQAPVAHVSFYEADAYARWRGYRLPTEAEWEVAASQRKPDLETANLLHSGRLHPRPLEANPSDGPVAQLIGDVWEWTASAYLPYPGYWRATGAMGEYNGKFMSGQMVLRGGSCVTPRDHIRVTYRNFFHPDKRWQFTGVRLAADV